MNVRRPKSSFKERKEGKIRRYLIHVPFSVVLTLVENVQADVNVDSLDIERKNAVFYVFGAAFEGLNT